LNIESRVDVRTHGEYPRVGILTVFHIFIVCKLLIHYGALTHIRCFLEMFLRFNFFIHNFLQEIPINQQRSDIILPNRAEIIKTSFRIFDCVRDPTPYNLQLLNIGGLFQQFSPEFQMEIHRNLNRFHENHKLILKMNNSIYIDVLILLVSHVSIDNI